MPWGHIICRGHLSQCVACLEADVVASRLGVRRPDPLHRAKHSGGSLERTCSLGVLYREVTIREKITPDGPRQIEQGWQLFHDGSGRELSSEDARRAAKA